MITAPTFRHAPRIIKHGKYSKVQIKGNDGAELYICKFPERKTAEKAVARFEQMNEKGETFESIKRQITFEFTSKNHRQFSHAYKDRLRQQYAHEIEWIASHPFLSSV
jgi:hypothetical protein